MSGRGRGRQMSKWRVHFTVENEKSKCKLCQKEISSTGGGTTNMKNHLRHNHYTEFFTINNQRQADDTAAESERDEEEEIAALESEAAESPSPSPSPSPLARRGSIMSPPPSPSPSPSPTPGQRRTATSGGGSTSSRRSSQTTLSEYRTPDSKAMERYNMGVAYFVATCNMPYSIVERDGFKVLCETLRPGYKPPGRKAVTNNYVPKLYSSTRDGLKAMLKEADWISLTSDAWTSKALEAFMSLTSHFISNDWILYAFTLCCRSFPANHTGINIKDWFSEALKEWEIRRRKVTCFTIDNGDNIRLAVDLLQVPSMRCFGHVIQTGVDVIQNTDHVKELKTASHRLQQLFASSRVKNRYEAYMKEANATPRVLPSPVATRWWSELPLLRILKEDAAHLRGFLAQYERGKHLDLRLSDAQNNTMLLVLATLEPLEELVQMLCGSKYVTASAVLPVVYLIEKMANTAVDGIYMDLSQAEKVKPDRDMLNAILHKLYKRYHPAAWQKFERQQRSTDPLRNCDVHGREEAYNLLIKCSYLDNRFKEDLTPDDIKAAREQLLEEVDPGEVGDDEGDGENPSETPARTRQPPPKKQKSMASLFAKFAASNNGSEQEQVAVALSQRELLKREMDRYDLLSLGKDEDILEWWKVHQVNFPILAKLARKYLAVPASSTESERLFSVAGLVINYLRTCLTGEHAEQLIFLSANKDFVPKP